MEELQVPTQRIGVEVFTAQGEVFPAGLFVTEAPHHGSRLDSVLQVLNDERSFLPLQTDVDEAGCLILNKNHLMRIKLEGPSEWLAPEGLSGFGQDGRSCSLLLGDGTRVKGQVNVDTPRSLSRLLDKLNRADRFMTVITPDCIELVQASHVVRVD